AARRGAGGSSSGISRRPGCGPRRRSSGPRLRSCPAPASPRGGHAEMPALTRSMYDLAGGEATFRLLVKRFYSRVAEDPVLRAVYPEEDLSGATERLTLFLIQYWGGPSTYSERSEEHTSELQSPDHLV